MLARNPFAPHAIVAAAIMAAAAVSATTVAPRPAPAAEAPDPLRHFEGEYVAPNFHFTSGETLPELRMHYTALGKPQRDAHPARYGRIWAQFLDGKVQRSPVR